MQKRTPWGLFVGSEEECNDFIAEMQRRAGLKEKKPEDAEPEEDEHETEVAKEPVPKKKRPAPRRTVSRK